MENIYAPPRSDLRTSTPDSGLINDLQWRGTWLLLFLTIITAGIYMAHYLKRQTNTLNQHLQPENVLKSRYANIILIISYFTVLMIPSLIYFEIVENYDMVDLLESLDNVLSLIYTIYLLIWSFEARSRFHSLLNLEKSHDGWLNGILTFIFTAFYFNFKVNQSAKSILNP